MPQRNLLVGRGFPGRLQALLLQRGIRPAALERDKVMTAATCRNWKKGRVYPDEYTYLALARYLKLNSQQAQALLRLPDEALLVTPSTEERTLREVYKTLDRIEDLIDASSLEQTLEIRSRLLAGLRATRKKVKEWHEQNTT